MGYPIKHIVGFDGETYDLGGGGGANFWHGAWTDLNNSKYSNMEIHNSDPLNVGDIVDVYNDNETEDTLYRRYVEVYDINDNIDNKILINMNGDSIINQDNSIAHLSPARHWYFLVVYIDDFSGDITLVPINTPMTKGYNTYTGGSIQYNDTDITEAACKVLSGYGCGSISIGSTYIRILPMDSNNNLVAPTEYAVVKAPSGRCTYIYYYATATNAIAMLNTETTATDIPSVPYLALAPYKGGINHATPYFDPDIHDNLRGWKFSFVENFTTRSYNWFIVDTIN